MRERLLLFCTILLLSACGSETSENQVTMLDCAEYAGSETVIERAQSHLIILGEMHGTNESVRAFEHLVCSALEQNIPVRVGLEANWSQGGPLNAALTAPIDMQTVHDAAPAMWGVHDGRSSIAVLELLKQISDWRLDGHPVSVFAFDAEPEEWVASENQVIARDNAMAKQVDRHLSDFDGAVILLTGEFHARKAVFKFADQSFIPMASLIKQRPVLSLAMRYGAGDAWVNVSVESADGTMENSVGPFKMFGNVGDDDARKVFKITDTEPGEFDGYYFTGPISSSPPAFPDSFYKPE